MTKLRKLLAIEIALAGAVWAEAGVDREVTDGAVDEDTRIIVDHLLNLFDVPGATCLISAVLRRPVRRLEVSP